MILTTCYRCGARLEQIKIRKEGVLLKCLRCPSCKEEFFTSTELLRFDTLTGRRKDRRKFGVLGDSLILRVPRHIAQQYTIKPGDYGVFEPRPDGILVRRVDAKE